MTRTCALCDFSRKAVHPTWPEPKLRCFRPRTFRIGGTEIPGEIGSATDFETDSFDESHRAVGDKCGPERKHWREKDVKA